MVSIRTPPRWENRTTFVNRCAHNTVKSDLYSASYALAWSYFAVRVETYRRPAKTQRLKHLILNLICRVDVLGAAGRTPAAKCIQSTKDGEHFIQTLLGLFSFTGIEPESNRTYTSQTYKLPRARYGKLFVRLE